MHGQGGQQQGSAELCGGSRVGQPEADGHGDDAEEELRDDEQGLLGIRHLQGAAQCHPINTQRITQLSFRW